MNALSSSVVVKVNCDLHPGPASGCTQSKSRRPLAKLPVTHPQRSTGPPRQGSRPVGPRIRARTASPHPGSPPRRLRPLRGYLHESCTRPEYPPHRPAGREQEPMTGRLAALNGMIGSQPGRSRVTPTPDRPESPWRSSRPHIPPSCLSVLLARRRTGHVVLPVAGHYDPPKPCGRCDLTGDVLGGGRCGMTFLTSRSCPRRPSVRSVTLMWGDPLARTTPSRVGRLMSRGESAA
jgi:hypothetical protein